MPRGAGRAGAVRVVGAVTVVAVLSAAAGCRGGGTGDSSAAEAVGSSTMRVRGVVLVRDLDAIRLNQDLEICHTLAPFADVAQGESVTVRGPGGRVLARGPLLSGRMLRGTAAGSGCGFAFDMLEVPRVARVEITLPGRAGVHVSSRSMTSAVLPVG